MLILIIATIIILYKYSKVSYRMMLLHSTLCDIAYVMALYGYVRRW